MSGKANARIRSAGECVVAVLEEDGAPHASVISKLCDDGMRELRQVALRTTCAIFHGRPCARRPTAGRAHSTAAPLGGVAILSIHEHLPKVK